MARVAKGVRGRLAIAFTTSAAAHLLTPRMLRLFRGRYPEIELSLSENNAAEITERTSGILVCGFLRVPVSRAAGLVFRTLLREPVLVAAPLDHRLAQKPRTGKNAAVALRDFHGENLILVRRSGAPRAICQPAGAVRGAGYLPKRCGRSRTYDDKSQPGGSGCRDFCRSSFDAARARENGSLSPTREEHPSECTSDPCASRRRLRGRDCLFRRAGDDNHRR